MAKSKVITKEYVFQDLETEEWWYKSRDETEVFGPFSTEELAKLEWRRYFRTCEHIE